MRKFALPVPENRFDRFVMVAAATSLVLMAWDLIGVWYPLSEFMILVNQLIMCILYFFMRKKHKENPALYPKEWKRGLKMLGGLVLFAFILVVLTSIIGLIGIIVRG